jgi:hypothetical protein
MIEGRPAGRSRTTCAEITQDCFVTESVYDQRHVP